MKSVTGNSYERASLGTKYIVSGSDAECLPEARNDAALQKDTHWKRRCLWEEDLDGEKRKEQHAHEDQASHDAATAPLHIVSWGWLK